MTLRTAAMEANALLSTYVSPIFNLKVVGINDMALSQNVWTYIYLFFSDVDTQDGDYQTVWISRV